MAFNVGNGNGDEESVLADINVTPLVDVMLVLLIIFMIAAPMLHQGIEVALPRAEAQNLPMRMEDPLVVSVNRDGQIFLREEPVEKDSLVEVLQAEISSRGGEDDTVFLKGDRELPYGDMIGILDLLHQGGITRIGMVTERPQREGRR
ncbi:MAG TPA: protein TolR [Thermoanaerobaculia bacterium]|nr:protein TolR [Thermoanaerobaculia bacterium]